VSKDPGDAQNDPAAKGKKIDDLRNITNRLSQSGYPAELRIGRTLMSAGWQVEHAAYFPDRAEARGERKWREIDIIAGLTTGPPRTESPPTWQGKHRFVRAAPVEASEILQVNYVVECKQSKHEWVVLVPGALPSEATVDAFPCFSPTGLGRDIVDYIDLIASSSDPDAAVHNVDDLLSLLPFTPKHRIGHGIVALADTARREQVKDRAYEAVEKTVRAVEFFERRQMRRLRQQSPEAVNSSSKLELAVYLPLVVLVGRLFTFGVSGSGQERLEQVTSGAVHFRGGGAGSGMIVPVVTTEALLEFAQLAHSSWLGIGAFTTSPGAVLGETETMLRLLRAMIEGGGEK
jgi:hypothetical protein